MALFILQLLRMSVVYKSVKVHLGQSQDLIMSTYILKIYTANSIKVVLPNT